MDSRASAVEGMHNGAPFRGVFVIMQTPFSDSLRIDETSLAREVEFLVRCGVHGLVWPVAASEATTLGLSERLVCADLIIREAGGRVPVVIGVTGHNKFEAMELAEHAQRRGASAVLTLPQMDMQPVDPAMFREYLAGISSACELPIFVQTSYPGCSSAIPPQILLQLAAEISAFRYVKEEQAGFGPLPWRITEYVQNDRRLLPMAGAGARNLLNEMARGSAGTMPGAGFADIQVQIWESYQEGRLAAARDLFSKMLMMAELEQSVGYVLQKEILRRRGVFQTTLMRHTRHRLIDDGDLRELDEIFATLRPFFRIPDGDF